MDLEKLFESLKPEEYQPMEDAIDRLMGDEEMYIEYLEKFPQNQNIIKLKKAVDDRNAKVSEDESHTLKGVAANLGILDVQDVCAEMVWNFRHNEPEEGFALMDELQEKFDIWVSRIQEV